MKIEAREPWRQNRWTGYRVKQIIRDASYGCKLLVRRNVNADANCIFTVMTQKTLQQSQKPELQPVHTDVTVAETEEPILELCRLAVISPEIAMLISICFCNLPFF